MIDRPGRHRHLSEIELEDDDLPTRAEYVPPDIEAARESGARAFKHWRDTTGCEGLAAIVSRRSSPWVDWDTRLHEAFMEGWNGTGGALRG